jgi:hypothetical protein
MLSFEEAREKAKKLNPMVDSCTEFEKGFAFSDSRAADSIGGGDAPVVIMKNTGKAVSFPVFVLGGTGKEIGERQGV